MDKTKKPFSSLWNMIKIIGLVLVIPGAVFLLLLVIIRPPTAYFPHDVPLTGRSFVAVRTPGSDYFTFYEQDGTFPDSPQNVLASDPPPRSFLDADGIHLLYLRSSAIFPLYGELDWAELPVYQILVVRECQRRAAGVPRGLRFWIENYTERSMVFVESEALIFANGNDWPREESITIPITDTQYQEIRRLLSEAPLALRRPDSIDMPRYWIEVRTDLFSLRGTPVYVEGSSLFEYLFSLQRDV